MINIVLYEPEIPQNTGNIMRTCVAMNMHLHLIEPLGFHMDEKHLRRSGMDYIKDLEYHIWHNWDAFIEYNHPEQIYYVTRYATHAPDEFTFTNQSDLWLVFGKESTGIDKHILAGNMEKCLRIPMIADARSMNLSNCVAIVAYEANRQLQYEGLVKHEVIKGSDYLEKYR